MCTTALRSPGANVGIGFEAGRRLSPPKCARRRPRWFSLAGGLLLLLITTLGVVWAFVVAHIALVAF